ADHRELVAVVPVERAEPGGQLDHRLALRVGGDVAVVEVHHVRRLDEGVIEILVGRVERVVDLERAARFRERADDLDIAAEIAREAAGGDAVDGVAGAALSVDGPGVAADVGDAVDAVPPGERVGGDDPVAAAGGDGDPVAARAHRHADAAGGGGIDPGPG